MKNMQYYQFSRRTDTDVSSNACSHMYTCSEDASWFDIMRQFATFLDSSGYVGVLDRIEVMLEELED